MEDLRAKLEKLLAEAEECDFIAKLASDPRKRELAICTDWPAISKPSL
jgi:hypothetical protein